MNVFFYCFQWGVGERLLIGSKMEKDIRETSLLKKKMSNRKTLWPRLYSAGFKIMVQSEIKSAKSLQRCTLSGKGIKSGICNSVYKIFSAYKYSHYHNT